MAFSTITKAEKQLKELSKIGSMENYIQCFHDLKQRIPSISMARHLCCFHGWSETSNPIVDCSSCGHLGIGPDDGSQGGSLFGR